MLNSEYIELFNQYILNHTVINTYYKFDGIVTEYSSGYKTLYQAISNSGIGYIIYQILDKDDNSLCYYDIES